MSSEPKYDCGNAERRSMMLMMLFFQGIKGLSPMTAPMREVETLCRPNRNPQICVIVNVMLEFRMTPEQRTRALPMWCYNGAISENRARDASSWANTRARANESLMRSAL